MRTSFPIATTLALLTLTAACNVRSTAPEQEGIGNTKADAGKTTAPKADAAADIADANVADADLTDVDLTVGLESQGDAAKGPIDGGFGDTSPGDGGQSSDDAGAPAAAKSRGFYVFSIDYNNSASIGALGLDGSVLSKSLISSGSDSPGLSLALGTDIVPANEPQVGGAVVILDRNNDAIDWLDLESAEVTNQVDVGPGDFASNPYDYVALSPELGFVSRYETNAAPGVVDYDQGGDLVAVNPTTKELLGRVDFNYLVEETPELMPRPTKMVNYAGKVYVVLGMLDGYFTPLEESVLAVVDPTTLEITSTKKLGLRNCEDISLAPSGGVVAIGCKGGWADEPLTVNSGIVLVDLDQAEPEIIHTYGAADLAGAQISTLAFASDSLIMFSSYGNFEPAANDRALVLDISDDSVSDAVLEAGPYQLGNIRCAPSDNVCVLANADTLAIEFFDVASDSISHAQTVVFDAELGLPPRYIGIF